MFIISKTIFNYKKLNCVLHFNNDQLPPPPGQQHQDILCDQNKMEH